MKLSGANVLHLRPEYYSEELVRLLHVNDFRAHTHLGNEGAKAYSRAIELGIDQCTFDDFSILDMEWF